MKPSPRIPAAFLVSHPTHFIALGFGSGLAPVAPGTFGSLAAWPLFLILAQFFTPNQILLLCLPLFVLGTYCCHRTGRDLGVADHGGIVWDEVVACLALLSLVPLAWVPQGLVLLLFRVFDILKPWPIRWFDARLKHGFGVMLDDLIAALFTYPVYLGVMALLGHLA